MTMVQLQKLAKDENMPREEWVGLKKQDLIFKILKERVKQNGLMYGEGTLEILPDGFGFLRSADYNYLPCADDIYISAQPDSSLRSAVRSVVAGQIRPPKENERYFAFLRVEAINYQDPDQLTSKVVFDDLTPLHPTKRFKLETDPTELNTRIIDLITPVGKGSAADRGPAANRQNRAVAKDGDGDHQEPSRMLRDRIAHRRTARRSDGDVTDGERFAR